MGYLAAIVTVVGIIMLAAAYIRSTASLGLLAFLIAWAAAIIMLSTILT